MFVWHYLNSPTASCWYRKKNVVENRHRLEQWPFEHLDELIGRPSRVAQLRLVANGPSQFHEKKVAFCSSIAV